MRKKNFWLWKENAIIESANKHAVDKRKCYYFNVVFSKCCSHFREYHGHYAEIPPSDWAIETAVHHIKKYAATLSDVGQTAMFDSTIYKLLRSNYGHVLGLDSLGYVLQQCINTHEKVIQKFLPHYYYFSSTSSDAVSLKKPLLALAEAMYRRISDLNRSGQPFRRAVLHGDLALYNLVTVTAAMVDSGSAAVEVVSSFMHLQVVKYPQPNYFCRWFWAEWSHRLRWCLWKLGCWRTSGGHRLCSWKGTIYFNILE